MSVDAHMLPLSMRDSERQAFDRQHGLDNYDSDEEEERHQNRHKFDSVCKSNRDCLALYDRFLYELPSYSHQTVDRRTGGPYELLKQTASHYANNAGRDMHKVQISCLVLHADDDPIVAGEEVNWDDLYDNKHFITMHTGVCRRLFDIELQCFWTVKRHFFTFQS